MHVEILLSYGNAPKMLRKNKFVFKHLFEVAEAGTE